MFIVCSVYQECERHGLKITGHAHDGDGKLRKAFYSLFSKRPGVGAPAAGVAGPARITLDHPLIQVFIPEVRD